MKSKNSEHYTQKYFDWQNEYGAFGGWANLSKFTSYISPEDTVLDFGCGGGYLLHNINCKNKIGVEINPSASEIAKSLGIRVFDDIDLIENDSIDIIISDNALEHTLHPYETLKKLYTKLKTGGKIIFVVPCSSISYKYSPNDINQHIFSWSPMCIGNLFTHAGFNVIESKKIYP